MKKINWGLCQKFSDRILAEGIFAIRARPPEKHSQVGTAQQGNYLISLHGEPYYIGEAKKLSVRIKQQFKENTSTFYKTYVKSVKSEPSAIDEFQVQHMETPIGRKEIEEFGIVNIPTPLNKFQLGKRASVSPAGDDVLWRDVQMWNAELLSEGEYSALAQPRAPWFDASVPPGAGIYMIWADGLGEALYIGESSDIGKRCKAHSKRTYFSALRRHIGTVLLAFDLKTIKGKSRYFSEEEDAKVTEFLRSCRIAFLTVSFGRFELEEHLIKKCHPLLNRKNNKIST